MCVIIQKPAGVELSEKDIVNAHKKNDDGFGLMVFDKKANKIVVQKGLVKDVQQIVDLNKKLTQFEVAYHFRIKTHGQITDQQCHPFRLLRKKNHGLDAFFMHNGCISKVKEEGNESDTQAFARHLHKILRHAPSLLEEPEWRKQVEEFIGSGNKLLFMYGEGKIFRLNDNNWYDHEGCRVSNKNFVEYTPARQTYQSSNYESDYADWPYTHTASKANGETTAYDLLGVEVQEKDSVWIYSNRDPEYMQEGKITDINRYSCEVEWKALEGYSALMTQRFYNKDGDPFNRQSEYFILPYAWGKTSEAINKSVEVLEGNKVEGNVIVLEDKTKTEDQKKVEESTSKKSEEAKTSINTLVEFDGVEWDSKDFRYGGAWLENSDGEYGVEMEDGKKYEGSIFNVFNMNPQERLNFFTQNTILSFAIFEDLLENFVLTYAEDLADIDEEVDAEEYPSCANIGA